MGPKTLTPEPLLGDAKQECAPAEPVAAEIATLDVSFLDDAMLADEPERKKG